MAQTVLTIDSRDALDSDADWTTEAESPPWTIPGGAEIVEFGDTSTTITHDASDATVQSANRDSPNNKVTMHAAIELFGCTITDTINFVRYTVRARANGSTGKKMAIYARRSAITVYRNSLYQTIYNDDHSMQVTRTAGNTSLTTSLANYTWDLATAPNGDPWTAALIIQTGFGVGCYSGYPSTVIEVAEIEVLVDYTAAGGGGSSRMRLHPFRGR